MYNHKTWGNTSIDRLLVVGMSELKVNAWWDVWGFFNLEILSSTCCVEGNVGFFYWFIVTYGHKTCMIY